jgi:tRNA-dihydrouridine synthase 3
MGYLDLSPMLKLKMTDRCHYGYKCRFLSAHMDSDGNLIRDEEKMARVGPQTLNALPHDLTIQLRSFKV